jgi:hypothetical protein
MGTGMADVPEVHDCGGRLFRIHGPLPLRRIGTDTRLDGADLQISGPRFSLCSERPRRRPRR